MCGICGVVALGLPPERETVARMTQALAHRGPDGEGFYVAEGVALGHRRLAIIDLSDAGQQPFASEDGLLQLIHVEVGDPDETRLAGQRSGDQNVNAAPTR
jgi:asparagine synthase (glutamine-hydrolysing)